jgi:hypothetical protein
MFLNCGVHVDTDGLFTNIIHYHIIPTPEYKLGLGSLGYKLSCNPNRYRFRP